MSISLDVVGSSLQALTVVIERGRLRFFADAIGETDPVYLDVEAARAAGFPDLPVPPTFLYGLALEGPDPFGWITDLGVDLRFILHGTQRFDYHAMAFAGDEVELRPRITDVYEKRNGALEFLVIDTEVTRSEKTIATMTQTIVVRHPEKDAAA